MLKQWLKYGLAGAAGLISLGLLWGLIEPYRLAVETPEATVPNLPEAWAGQRIGQISDFQLGMWMHNINTARRGVEYLAEQRPAAVIISGDFIYKSLPDAEVEISKVVDVLKPLTAAEIPTYAVLGNHDYSHEPPVEALGQEVHAALEAVGIQVLENEAVALELPDQPGGSPLYLVGIGSRIAGKAEVATALAALPPESPRIALMHNPTSFLDFPADTAPFAVAGHTHGGQIRPVPFRPDWSVLKSLKDLPFPTDGWARDYGEPGNRLYINRGIGFSDVPLRINCPPEVTLFTLTGASDSSADSRI